MKWRDFLLVVLGSVVLHLVIFWPDPKVVPASKASNPFFVTIQKAASDEQHGSAAAEPAEEAALAAAGLAQGSAPDSDQPVAAQSASIRTGSTASTRKDKAVRPPPEMLATVQLATPRVPDSPVGPIAPSISSDAEADFHKAGSADLTRYRLGLAREIHLRWRGMAGSALDGQLLVVLELSSPQAGLRLSIGETSGRADVDSAALALVREAVMVLPAPRLENAAVIRLPMSFHGAGREPASALIPDAVR